MTRDYFSFRCYRSVIPAIVTLLLVRWTAAQTDSSCVPLTMETCTGFGYNQTTYPNKIGHTSQTEASQGLGQYRPLIKVNCSPHIKFFLCAIYAPPCTHKVKLILPCKSLCESARAGCGELMVQYGFEWPEELACDELPDAENQLCIKPLDEDTLPRKHPNGPPYDLPSFKPRPHGTQTPYNGSGGYICPAPLRVPSGNNYKLHIDDFTLQDCGAPCVEDWYFNESQRSFARLFIGVWAIICLCSTLFTVLTFIIDRQRFRYPERPIIFLSACYMVVAACYVAGFALGDQVSCNKKFDASVPGMRREDMDRVIVQGTRREPCTVLFMLLYFFQMSSALWWVILTLTWFLAAGLKWGHEAIEANSQYFHLVAWTVPAVQTIAVLALQQIDGDVLAGVCYTGLSDVRILRGFIIAPLLVYELLGACFLLAGLISLFRIRTIMKADGSPGTDKLEKLMLRIGLFSVLYLVPATALLACQLYEQSARASWSRAWLEQRCKHQSQACLSVPTPGAGQQLQTSKPEFSILMIKYVMTLIVGVTSGFWVWSGKTLQSWRRLYCCGTKSRGAPADHVHNGYALPTAQQHVNQPTAL